MAKVNAAAGACVKNVLSALKRRRRSGRPRSDPPPYRGDDDEVLGFVVLAGGGGEESGKSRSRADAPRPGEVARRSARTDSTRAGLAQRADEAESRARAERDPKRAVTGSLHPPI